MVFLNGSMHWGCTGGSEVHVSVGRAGDRGRIIVLVITARKSPKGGACLNKAEEFSRQYEPDLL